MLFNAVHSVIYRLQAVIENEGCHIEQGLKERDINNGEFKEKKETSRMIIKSLQQWRVHKEKRHFNNDEFLEKKATSTMIPGGEWWTDIPAGAVVGEEAEIEVGLKAGLCAERTSQSGEKRQSGDIQICGFVPNLQKFHSRPYSSGRESVEGWSKPLIFDRYDPGSILALDTFFLFKKMLQWPLIIAKVQPYLRVQVLKRDSGTFGPIRILRIRIRERRVVMMKLGRCSNNLVTAIQDGTGNLSVDADMEAENSSIDVEEP
ncbi:hypothetical protein LAZ67_17002219 [Cordylochernes scorpioides]|uniref:Uncharacterized protein n=1 Tax=Cordylochernes scorpioides TaxID=51811 RepID=A0ABY6LE54_9ARAC|nr:hypothetical protein LAZ67_17002219 [Cordylochernes scorpioides]